jgi:FixJ family two-component response regulator
MPQGSIYALPAFRQHGADAMSVQSASVIVVDDDASVCQATHRLLSAAGFHAHMYYSAEALLASAAVDGKTCLVLDINLPGLSGFELVEHLEAHGSGILPVVFITAYDQPAYAIQARRREALAYVLKPFSAVDLIAAIRGVMAFGS